jgi:outer membrane protein OmpA-like peptidoglycan-associated protein
MTTPKITLGGETYAVLRADTLEAPDEYWARQLVERILDEDPGAAGRLVDLAESLTGEWSMNVADAMATVARAIARGDLVVLRDRGEDDKLRSSKTQPHDLRDIGDDVDPDGPVSPGGGRDAPAPMTRTWISFEVVDDRGEPVVGEFRVAIDADEDSGKTEDGKQFYDDVRAEADARLRLDLLRWPVHDQPSVDPKPPAVLPDTPAGTSFRVIDDQSQGVRGRFSATTSTGTVGGDLGAQPVTLGAPTAAEGGTVELSELDLDPRPISPASLQADHVVEIDHPLDQTVAVKIPSGATTIVVRRPRLRRLRNEGLRFANDSSLLVPLARHDPMAALATAIATLEAEPSSSLVVVGHASAAGSGSRNEELGQLRADATRAMLERDEAAWVAVAEAHGSAADVQRFLLHLHTAHGWPTDPGRTDGVVDAGTSSAVRSFQHHVNAHMNPAPPVAEDGEISRATWSALFAVQVEHLRLQCQSMGVSATTPAAIGASMASIGCADRFAQHPRFEESSEDAAQRRVDLIVVPADVAWNEGPALDALIGASSFTWIDVHGFAVGPGDLLLELVDHHGRPLVDETYTLSTDAEVRTGRSDANGYVVERGLSGTVTTLELSDGAALLFDRAYLEASQRRHDEPAPEVALDPDHEWPQDADEREFDDDDDAADVFDFDDFDDDAADEDGDE